MKGLVLYPLTIEDVFNSFLIQQMKSCREFVIRFEDPYAREHCTQGVLELKYQTVSDCHAAKTTLKQGVDFLFGDKIHVQQQNADFNADCALKEICLQKYGILESKDSRLLKISSLVNDVTDKMLYDEFPTVISVLVQDEITGQQCALLEFLDSNSAIEAYDKTLSSAFLQDSRPSLMVTTPEKTDVENNMVTTPEEMNVENNMVTTPEKTDVENNMVSSSGNFTSTPKIKFSQNSSKINKLKRKLSCDSGIETKITKQVEWNINLSHANPDWQKSRNSESPLSEDSTSCNLSPVCNTRIGKEKSHNINSELQQTDNLHSDDSRKIIPKTPSHKQDKNEGNLANSDGNKLIRNKSDLKSSSSGKHCGPVRSTKQSEPVRGTTQCEPVRSTNNSGPVRSTKHSEPVRSTNSVEKNMDCSVSSSCEVSAYQNVRISSDTKLPTLENHSNGGIPKEKQRIKNNNKNTTQNDSFIDSVGNVNTNKVNIDSLNIQQIPEISSCCSPSTSPEPSTPLCAEKRQALCKEDTLSDMDGTKINIIQKISKAPDKQTMSGKAKIEKTVSCNKSHIVKKNESNLRKNPHSTEENIVSNIKDKSIAVPKNKLIIENKSEKCTNNVNTLKNSETPARKEETNCKENKNCETESDGEKNKELHYYIKSAKFDILKYKIPKVKKIEKTTQERNHRKEEDKDDREKNHNSNMIKNDIKVHKKSNRTQNNISYNSRNKVCSQNSREFDKNDQAASSKFISKRSQLQDRRTSNVNIGVTRRTSTDIHAQKTNNMKVDVHERQSADIDFLKDKTECKLSIETQPVLDNNKYILAQNVKDTVVSPDTPKIYDKITACEDLDKTVTHEKQLPKASCMMSLNIDTHQAATSIESTVDLCIDTTSLELKKTNETLESVADALKKAEEIASASNLNTEETLKLLSGEISSVLNKSGASVDEENNCQESVISNTSVDDTYINGDPPPNTLTDLTSVNSGVQSCNKPGVFPLNTQRGFLPKTHEGMSPNDVNKPNSSSMSVYKKQQTLSPVPESPLSPIAHSQMDNKETVPVPPTASFLNTSHSDETASFNENTQLKHSEVQKNHASVDFQIDSCTPNNSLLTSLDGSCSTGFTSVDPINSVPKTNIASNKSIEAKTRLQGQSRVSTDIQVHVDNSLAQDTHISSDVKINTFPSAELVTLSSLGSNYRKLQVVIPDEPELDNSLQQQRNTMSPISSDDDNQSAFQEFLSKKPNKCNSENSLGNRRVLLPTPLLLIPTRANNTLKSQQLMENLSHSEMDSEFNTKQNDNRGKYRTCLQTERDTDDGNKKAKVCREYQLLQPVINENRKSADIDDFDDYELTPQDENNSSRSHGLLRTPVNNDGGMNAGKKSRGSDDVEYNSGAVYYSGIHQSCDTRFTENISDCISTYPKRESIKDKYLRKYLERRRKDKEQYLSKKHKKKIIHHQENEYDGDSSTLSHRSESQNRRHRDRSSKKHKRERSRTDGDSYSEENSALQDDDYVHERRKKKRRRRYGLEYGTYLNKYDDKDTSRNHEENEEIDASRNRVGSEYYTSVEEHRKGTSFGYDRTDLSITRDIGVYRHNKNYGQRRTYSDNQYSHSTKWDERSNDQVQYEEKRRHSTKDADEIYMNRTSKQKQYEYRKKSQRYFQTNDVKVVEESYYKGTEKSKHQRNVRESKTFSFDEKSKQTNERTHNGKSTASPRDESLGIEQNKEKDYPRKKVEEHNKSAANKVVQQSSRNSISRGNHKVNEEARLDNEMPQIKPLKPLDNSNESLSNFKCNELCDDTSPEAVKKGFKKTDIKLKLVSNIGPEEPGLLSDSEYETVDELDEEDEFSVFTDYNDELRKGNNSEIDPVDLYVPDEAPDANTITNKIDTTMEKSNNQSNDKVVELHAVGSDNVSKVNIHQTSESVAFAEKEPNFKLDTVNNSADMGKIVIGKENDSVVDAEITPDNELDNVNEVNLSETPEVIDSNETVHANDENEITNSVDSPISKVNSNKVIDEETQSSDSDLPNENTSHSDDIVIAHSHDKGQSENDDFIQNPELVGSITINHNNKENEDDSVDDTLGRCDDLLMSIFGQ